MKKIIYILSLIFAAIVAYAQDVPVTSDYIYNPLLINPARAGSNGNFINLSLLNRSIDTTTSTQLFISNRNSWLSNNQPSGFQTFTADHLLYRKQRDGSALSTRMGIGGGLIHMYSGPMRRIGVNIDYAYHLPLSRSISTLGMSFGIRMSYTNQSISANYIAKDDNDAFLNSNYWNGNLFNMGFGINTRFKGLNVDLSLGNLLNLGSNSKNFSSFYRNSKGFRPSYYAGLRYNVDLTTENKYYLEPIIATYGYFNVISNMDLGLNTKINLSKNKEIAKLNTGFLLHLQLHNINTTQYPVGFNANLGIQFYEKLSLGLFYESAVNYYATNGYSIGVMASYRFHRNTQMGNIVDDDKYGSLKKEFRYQTRINDSIINYLSLNQSQSNTNTSFTVNPSIVDYEKRIDSIYSIQKKEVEIIVRNKVNDIIADNFIDDDQDGVANMFDKEPNTKRGCPVDVKGIKLDSDKDGLSDCDDKEPYSTIGLPIDANGVAIPK